MPKCVAYLRVSTAKQGNSGLGLDAQREAIRSFLKDRKWKLIDEVIEVESGKRNDRPALANALALCRVHNATLIVGKLDRLARNTKFLLTVVEGSGEAGVVFCDLPTIPDGAMGKYIVTNMAAIAELEAGLTSQRTKAALRAAKARGVVLGCRNGRIARYATRGATASAQTRAARAQKRSADLLPVIEALKGAGASSLRQLAAGLNDRGIAAPRGGSWSAVQVQRVTRFRNVVTLCKSGTRYRRYHRSHE